MKILNKKKKKTASAAENEVQYSYVLGKKRPFATAEAHKRLRTNVFFSFPEEKACRVIGVTSAMAHEGKTTTSINLAYDMLQAGKKVLLIDADMRMSNIVKITSIKRVPGLSDLLVSSRENNKCIQVEESLGGLNIISCGSIPPNPSELLSSNRMAEMMELLKERYEYIIIDLPPIAAVSDALIVSKMVDGMIVVVRQDYADKNLLDDAIRQLRFNEANIIGFVMNCAHTENKYYGKYGKYGKYGRYGRYGKYAKYGYYRNGGYGRYGDYYKKPEDSGKKNDS